MGRRRAALSRMRSPGCGPRACRGEAAALFDAIVVSPVLTAHPTEVRRKSILDREMEVAQLLATRDRMRLTPAEAATRRPTWRAPSSRLWQTSLVRRGRPTVIER